MPVSVRLRRGASEEIMPGFFSNLGLEAGDEVVLSSASGGNAQQAK